MTRWSLRRRRRTAAGWPAQPPPSPWGPRPGEWPAGDTGRATTPNPAIRDGRGSRPAPGPAASAPAAEALAAAPPALVLPPQSASRLAPALPPAPDGADGRPWPEICEQFGLHLLVLAEQLRLSLDELEADEDDPERLEQLYRIDHGVTRMRRPSRDPRVLARRGEGALDGPVTSLLDVIRMAASAIDRYGQVQVGKAAELAVVGYAADDVGSLMAALLENATQYSPETVTVSAHLMGDGAVMFRIEDSGIGMPPEQVAALNEMLAGPVPDVDERTGRHTGFPVAHRIARRHMI